MSEESSVEDPTGKANIFGFLLLSAIVSAVISIVYVLFDRPHEPSDWLIALSCIVVGVLAVLLIVSWRSPRVYSALGAFFPSLVNVAAVVVVGILIVSGFAFGATAELAGQFEDASHDGCRLPEELKAPEKQTYQTTREHFAKKVGRAQKKLNGLQNRTPPASSQALRKARRALRSARAQLSPPKASPTAATTTLVKLGHSKNSGIHTVTFTTKEAVPSTQAFLPVTAGPFVASNGHQLDPDTVLAWAEVAPDRKHGTVSFCIPSTQRPDAPSGEFSGSLSVDQGAVQRLDLPVTLSLAYPNSLAVFGIGLGVCLVGSWYLFFLRRNDLPPSIVYDKIPPPNETDEQKAMREEKFDRVLRWPFGFWHGYWRWVCSASGAITIVTGLFAAGAVFASNYLQSEAWSSDFQTWQAFCLSVGAAFVAAGTAGKLAQNATSKKEPPPAANANASRPKPRSR